MHVLVIIAVMTWVDLNNDKIVSLHYMNDKHKSLQMYPESTEAKDDDDDTNDSNSNNNNNANNF